MPCLCPAEDPEHGHGPPTASPWELWLREALRFGEDVSAAARTPLEIAEGDWPGRNRAERRSFFTLEMSHKTAGLHVDSPPRGVCFASLTPFLSCV